MRARTLRVGVPARFGALGAGAAAEPSTTLTIARQELETVTADIGERVVREAAALTTPIQASM